MTSTSVRELRDMTGETQKEFAERLHIPLSTLRKWEQGAASPPQYVLEMIAACLPANQERYQKIGDRGTESYYYDRIRHEVSDRFGNTIAVEGDLDQVNQNNLILYLHDLYEAYYQAVDRFNRDCRLDQQEHIVWK